MNSTIAAIIFASISTTCYGLENALVKNIAKKIAPNYLIIYRGFFIIPLAIIATLIFRQTVNFELLHVGIGFGLAFASYFGYLFLVKALKFGYVGVVTPICSSRILVAVLIGTIFLKNQLSFASLLSIVIIFLGIILLSINLKNLKNSALFSKQSGIVYAIFSALVWGVVFPLFSIPTAILGAFLFTIILEITGPLISSLVLNINKKSVFVKEYFYSNFIDLVKIGILAGFGTILLNLAYATKEAVIASTINGVTPLIALIYSRVFQKELMSIKQYFAAFMIIGGLICLSYFSA